MGHWDDNPLEQSYMNHIPINGVLAAAGHGNQETPLQDRYFHERFCIKFSPEHEEYFEKKLFPWLAAWEADAAKVRKAADAAWMGIPQSACICPTEC